MMSATPVTAIIFKASLATRLFSKKLRTPLFVGFISELTWRSSLVAREALGSGPTICAYSMHHRVSKRAALLSDMSEDQCI